MHTNEYGNTVKRIAAENDGKTVACATHGGVMRCLHCRLLLGDINRLSEMGWSDNTAVTLLRFDKDNKVEVVFYNDSSHLPEELIPKRSRLPHLWVMKNDNNVCGSRKGKNRNRGIRPRESFAFPENGNNRI